MTPSELYSTVLANLTSARSIMLSAAWQASLDESTIDIRVEAGNAMMHLQGAILALSNASLSDIAEEMQLNEADLKSYTGALAQALQQISQVQTVLNNVTKVLNVVAKVVPLL
jgi:hypothetical protein